MRSKQKFLFATACLLIIGGGSLFYAWQTGRELDKLIQHFDLATSKSEGLLFARLLNGTMASVGQENLLPIAVMVENHIAARPLSGLSKAQVVYETLAEADITRFLAVYDLSTKIDKIGPVRSARPYYIALASEYGGFYVHSGGSPDSLDLLKVTKSVTDLNEFFGYNTEYFWRDSSKLAPHNLYTSTDLLAKAEQDYELGNQGGFVAWQFKADGQASTSTAEIKINFSQESDYQVVWQYNGVENIYERWQNNRRHKDEDGAPINAKNIVIQYAPMKILDAIGRKEFDLSGVGQAVIFEDGQVIEGRWKKSNQRTIFYDKNNQEIKFNRGVIWIEIVPDESMVSY